MKLTAMKSFRHGATMVGRGVAVDVTAPIARDLIKRGLAVAEETDTEKMRERLALAPVKPKPSKAGNIRRDDRPATTGRAADRKED